MTASCVLLVLAVFLSSTLAKPMAYVDRNGQSGINNDYLQYLLTRHGNGTQNFYVITICMFVRNNYLKQE